MFIFFSAAIICPVRSSRCRSRPATPSEPRRTAGSWNDGASQSHSALLQIFLHLLFVSSWRLIRPLPVAVLCPAGSWRRPAAAAAPAPIQNRSITPTTGRTRGAAGTAATPSASRPSAPAAPTWRTWTPAFYRIHRRDMRGRWTLGSPAEWREIVEVLCTKAEFHKETEAQVYVGFLSPMHHF